MRIKEFSLRRYGPLPDSGVVLLDNFTLFSGKNEDGKTLTVDGLVKMLFHKKKDRKIFKDLDRVEESGPEGYLIIEDNEGKEIRLPERKDITEITGLNAREWNNIFIIRDSDLIIPPDDGDFYRSITDRLAGLWTGEISSIKGKLKDLGRLTQADSGATLSDSRDYENMKSRLKDAHDLIENVEKLQKEIEKEGFDRLEEKISKITGEREELEQRVTNLDLARKREKYETGNKALEKLQKALSELEKLRVYREEDEQLWRDGERDLRRLTEEKNILRNRLGSKEKEFGQTKKEFEKKKRDFQIFEKRKKELDEEIRPEIKNYQKETEKLAFQRGQGRFFTAFLKISVTLLAIALLGIMARPSPIFNIFASLFAITTIISWLFNYFLARREAKLQKIFGRLKFNSAKLQLGGEDIGEVLSNIERFSEDYSREEEHLKEVDKKVSLLETEIRTLKEEEMVTVSDRLRDLEEKIEAVKRKSGEEILPDYHKKLGLKLDYEGLKDKQEGILKSHFGSQEETLAINLSYWNDKLSELEEYRGMAKEVTYSEKEMIALKKEQKSLSDKKHEIRDKMIGFQEKLREVERRANETLRPEGDYFHCASSVDLKAIGSKLQDFIFEIEDNKNNVLAVMRIFEEIAREKEEKISDLFGKTSSISKYFAEITGGIYKEVNFNQATKKIEATREDGVVLDVQKLSGGAYDQLYLSVRLALGEKLLKDNKGFFIMDDPFIKADAERLQKQFNILRKINELGWQVIYFTAKDEVKSVLKPAIESKKIQCHEMAGIYSY